jgi:hypothetical protein
MSYKCSYKNEVTFKITVERVIDQMTILKVTSFFDEYLINTYMIFRITRLEKSLSKKKK